MAYLGSAVLTINDERVEVSRWYIERTDKVICVDRFGAVVFIER